MPLNDLAASIARSSDVSAIATLAPCSANTFARAFPIPLAPPVTNTILFLNVLASRFKFSDMISQVLLTANSCMARAL